MRPIAAGAIKIRMRGTHSNGGFWSFVAEKLRAFRVFSFQFIHFPLAHSHARTHARNEYTAARRGLAADVRTCSKTKLYRNI